MRTFKMPVVFVLGCIGRLLDERGGCLPAWQWTKFGDVKPDPVKPAEI